ncbi:discoidin domain-containing protein [Protaetiibacter larvae]|uniref:Discoidin domain-containing protein n=2 Tax=Protaetiibacter larvae TaxID=2592654 RepID=A0A5C1YB79_9MICO|nr:discoidin domain-containing protein [Protaetiibacter larvae]
MQGVALSGQWGYSLYEMAVYAPTAPPASTNVAQGKTATASSSSNAQQSAAAAVDGDLGTRWSASESATNWLQVDLGANYALNRVTIEWEAAYATGYKLQRSPNGTTWTDVFTETAGNGGTDDIPITATTRYLRMQGVTKATPWGYSIYELRAYGVPAG